MQPSCLNLLPKDIAFSHQVIPVSASGGKLRLASCRHLDAQAIREIEFVTNHRVQVTVLQERELLNRLHELYGYLDDREESLAYSVVNTCGSDSSQSSLNSEVDNQGVVSLLNKLITHAICQRASDIHIEPCEMLVRTRFRIDGVLQCRDDVPSDMRNGLISRIKIVSGLDIAERRRPQDGRIRVTNGDRNIDLRVSTMPTDFGEKVVLRVLDKGVLGLDLDAVGLEPEALAQYRQAITFPYGMILVTGPTGSGKTTTLYATLNHLNSEAVNILTIEDPIEYNLAGINQAQMRADIGFTFANALKTFLRQDPDVIMVGEIRDLETAEIAVRAALTGHLVFSTLHTNDAASAITRLIDLGIEPFLAASCIRLVLAQRLVRRICSHCKRVVQPPEPGQPQPLQPGTDDLRTFEGEGCERCHQTGYHGRLALLEMLRIDSCLAKAITQGITAPELKLRACQAGMRALSDDGRVKVRQGLTTLAEVHRETGG